MKLRNKKTGEIGNLVLNINPNRESYSVLSTENGDAVCGNLVIADYNSLTKLNEEWEDYEEKGWYITENGEVRENRSIGIVEEESEYREIGNYFEAKEEAEKAVEKLKAWKRLKDKQFKFYGWNKGSLLKSLPNTIMFACDDTKIWSWEDIRDDLDLLFGGEE